jgi:hypothetical protein
MASEIIGQQLSISGENSMSRWRVIAPISRSEPVTAIEASPSTQLRSMM